MLLPAQAWREDRTLIAAGECIADALGQRYVESIPLSMEAAWAESAPRTAPHLPCCRQVGAAAAPLLLMLHGLMSVWSGMQRHKQLARSGNL